MKVICVIGTRPEAIKMAPVIQAFRAKGGQGRVLAPAQHRGLPGQSPVSLTGTLVPALDPQKTHHA